MRHKIIAGDAAIFGVLMAIGGAFFFLFDLGGHRSIDPHIDLEELLLLGIGLGACLAWFGWRRIVEQERQIVLTTQAESQARYLACHDHLTGLPNRRRLQEALEAALAPAPKEASGRALLLLDLNGFKAINDIHGHGRGDAVLCVVAARLAGAMHAGDLLARTGGDEFAALVHDLPDTESVTLVAERLIRSFVAPIVIDGGRHSVGTAIGIARIPGDGNTSGDLMRKADVALYKAKAAGGSTYAFFHEDMDREALEREGLRRDLACAIEAGRIVPHYQPIVDLESGDVRAFEALARWIDPVLGVVPPDRFIPLAEETGMIRALSDRLLQRACEDAMRWPAHVGLAFNVSPVQLRDATFGLRVLHIIGTSGLAPGRLELEITESAITSDLEAATDSLGPLREAGLRIVLDDFGTGATSLAHLRSFKFDGLKIDRRFVALMTEENESAAIVRAIIGLAKGLGLTIVAEGVEKLAQRRALAAEGCAIGQGYFFGKAVPVEQAIALFEPQATRTG